MRRAVILRPFAKINLTLRVGARQPDGYHEVRTLLQVKVREADEANDLFGRLMGDEVEPRREFIQDNALSVANLDV